MKYTRKKLLSELYPKKAITNPCKKLVISKILRRSRISTEADAIGPKINAGSEKEIHKKLVAILLWVLSKRVKSREKFKILIVI
jgi:hypothetical protein